MARTLYRFYLYFVFIAMAIFAAVALGRLLQALLRLTPLIGMYGSRPSNQEVVQAIVFAIVAWIIAGLLGGLHYWLIRRDMASDPSAGGSAVRSFFLNIVELIASPLGVAVSAFGFIMGLGTTSDVTVAAAFSLAALVLVVFLEWERQRTKVNPGAAMAFQRLHLYGVQLILLFLLTIAWLNTVRMLIDGVIFGGQGSTSFGGPPPCGGFTVCQGPNLLTQALGLLWIALFWIGYGYFTRKDAPSLLRQILHFASFAYGVGFALVGIYRGIELLLLPLFSVSVPLKDITGPGASYDFASPLTLGLVVIAVYSLWLIMTARQQPNGQVITVLVGEAITAVLMAAVFWWGVGNLLLNALESFVPVGSAPDARSWVSALAFFITGIAYISLDLHLRSRNMQDAATASGPRRGFVFALLAGGALAGAIGGVVALYALLTALLGSPLTNWQHVARIGLAAFIVGVIIVGVYLWIANLEHLFTGLVRQPAPPPPPAPKPETIEEILDELLAGKISRDEAAIRLHKLVLVHS